MTAGPFRSAVDQIKEDMAKLQARLSSIQSECSHPKEALIRKPGSNTGNYDPSADCYWIDFHCTLCDKFWTEDQPK